MIFKLLDAYAEEIKQEDSFFKRISKMNTKNKIFSGIVIMLAFLYLYLSMKYIKISIVVIGGIVFFIVVEILSVIMRKDRRKQYLKNVTNYNERLDKLKELLFLEEFSITSAPKLSALIEKINKYIERESKRTNENKIEKESFLNNIIFPVLAFITGILATEVRKEEVVALAIIALCILLWTRSIIKGIIKPLVKYLNPTMLEMECLVDELQDLYDRDYIEDIEIELEEEKGKSPCQTVTLQSKQS